MSLIPLFLPIQLSQVIDDWKHVIKKSDKQVQIDLGFRSAPDFSKAKHGRDQRPFCLHRFLRCASKEDALAFVDVLRDYIEGDGQPTPEAPIQHTDRDLWLAMLTRLDQIGQAVGVRKQAKAERPHVDAETERVA